MGVPEQSLAERLALAFRDAGEELYLVGGAVRDEMLQILSSDELDFATSAVPERTVEVLQPLGLGRPFRVGEKFGTIGLRHGDRAIEITTYRGEVYQQGSRKPSVRFGTSLVDDLRRRDFTINAMARDPLSEEIVDPFGGRADLSKRILRSVGDPDERFAEDPLRLLRAVRFAARLDLTIDAGTWSGLRRSAGSLENISRERIRDEYGKILLGPHAARGLELLRDGGLMAHSVPELLELTRMPDHGPLHPLSLWDHVMRVVELVPAEPAPRWAALLHDIAKPATRAEDPGGRPRFFYHEEVGAETARRILSGLRYPNRMVEDVVVLVETHMQFHGYGTEWRDGAVRRLMLRLGPLMSDGIALARADAAGHSLGEHEGDEAKYRELEERVQRLSEEPPETSRSPLSGDDLMERYKLPPGPWIRRVKDALLEEVLEGRMIPTDLDAAWKVADRVVSSEAESPDSRDEQA